MDNSNNDKGSKGLTGVRKRQQIQAANRAMLIWVGVAAAVVTICLVLGYNFVQRISYNGKVIAAKNETNGILKQNKENIQLLKNNVNKLQANQSLLALRADPNDTAFQVIIDALPTVDDRTALAASLQDRILAQSNVRIEQVSVTDIAASSPVITTPDGESTLINVAPSYQTINFSFVISGDYSSIASAIRDVERTIRPIVIDSMTIEGTANSLKATVNATTYFVPGVVYTLGSREVQP